MSNVIIDHPNKFRQAFRRLLVAVGITLVSLEILLGLFDPLGLAYFNRITFMNQYYVIEPARYPAFRLSPGVYQMGSWSATVTDDLTRLVPDDGGGRCQVAFVGDSVIWGWGVNDGETMTNVIARQMPDINAVDYGMITYSSDDVRKIVEVLDYDLAVYLIIENDNEPATIKKNNHPPSGVRHFPGFGLLSGGESALAWYNNYLLFRLFGTPPPTDNERFMNNIGQIAARGDVLLVAFDEPLGRLAAERFPVTLLTYPYTTVSRVDSHPDAASHRQAAQEMLPTIRDAVARRCG